MRIKCTLTLETKNSVERHKLKKVTNLCELPLAQTRVIADKPREAQNEPLTTAYQQMEFDFSE